MVLDCSPVEDQARPVEAHLRAAAVGVVAPGGSVRPSTVASSSMQPRPDVGHLTVVQGVVDRCRRRRARARAARSVWPGSSTLELVGDGLAVVDRSRRRAGRRRGGSSTQARERAHRGDRAPGRCWPANQRCAAEELGELARGRARAGLSLGARPAHPSLRGSRNQ